MDSCLAHSYAADHLDWRTGHIKRREKIKAWSNAPRTARYTSQEHGNHPE